MSWSRSMLIILATASFGCWSATLNLSLKGDELVFRNAQQSQVSGSYALTDWLVVSDLAPTTHWQPGMITTTANKFILKGPGGSVELPIKLTGIEYNTAGVSDLISEDQPLVSGPSCSGSISNNGGIISFTHGSSASTVGMNSENCFSGLSYYLSKNVQPFYFVRPIFSLNKQDMLTAFESLGDPLGGIYTGNIPISLKYYYKANGITTYRNISIATFSVQVNYYSDTVKSIQADALKVIEPIYDKSNHTASGETEFNILVNGYFQSGIRMTFADKEYTMKPVNSDGFSEIPYYIRCETCEVISIVENGKLTIDAQTPVERRVKGATNSFEYKLKVGYENISAENISSGEYLDTFTVIVEEIL
ncbi:hypothetical protein HJ067_21410 [Vibrio parahaemolyticus]|uniref:hypothetical protein n=1 Tax=Vibrio alginolyticus TaxID=663 RepID=UPI0023AF13DB|nr:hypothetical protein [Vibrio alginolyticus]MBE4295590.1 hypothetical protein [Vibrio parahaemolyticus]WED60834.1 hypothetical protein O6P42_07095 [Vibrio alginolyticus]